MDNLIYLARQRKNDIARRNGNIIYIIVIALLLVLVLQGD
jgi:hypothetical protein